ncbi:MAG: arsenic transporter [Acidobacteriota bacterium]|nr:arsenic transporter [Acidobacteriota bacterium]
MTHTRPPGQPEAATVTVSAVLVWAIAAGTIAAILIRPKKWPEAVWATLGAMLLVLTGLLNGHKALAAIAKGTDVYLFLTGMMLLAELARREGVFDWLAALAVRAARGSRTRLFGLIYCAGIAVTVFLSNDATAVVLTPAVYAAVKRARVNTLPYLLICAFIANAASFVLPISNPANLVVYGRELPPLMPWLRTFLLPSVFAITATFFCLRLAVRDDLQGSLEDGSEPPRLTGAGRLAAGAIAGSGGILIAASWMGLDLGLPTCLAALIAVALGTRARLREAGRIAAGVSWSVLPLVAGLFVLVEGLNEAGALRNVSDALKWCGVLPRLGGGMTASFGIAALSNLMNNLPSGLLAGGAVQAAGVAPYIRDSVLIGVDLGPNLSVTGSLATVLWLLALRREGERIGAIEFLRIGAIVMPPALLASTLAVVLLSR